MRIMKEWMPLAQRNTLRKGASHPPATHLLSMILSENRPRSLTRPFGSGSCCGVDTGSSGTLQPRGPRRIHKGLILLLFPRKQGGHGRWRAAGLGRSAAALVVAALGQQDLDPLGAVGFDPGHAGGHVHRQ